jgi:hypothetical protein
MYPFHFGLRAAAAGLLAASLLLPTAASAGPLVPSGTVVGTVTCGAAEETHATNIVVMIEGLGMSTHTDASGKFSLTGVPVGQALTVDALGSPDAFTTASRYNVAVQAGQTVDIGNLDLSVCPAAGRADDDRSPSQVEIDNSFGSDRD